MLFLFGIMLTRAPIGRPATSTTTSAGWPPVVGLLLARRPGVVLSTAFQGTSTCTVDRRPAHVGRRHVDLHATYVVPFEVVSVVLLAALVGAVVIARRD